MREPFWRRYLRFWGPDVRSDVDEELQFHFEMRVEQFLAAGMSREEAVEAARRRFGDVEQTRRTLRAVDQRGLRRHLRADWWDAFRQDLRLATRGIRREPAFAVAVVVTLGLGIGANAAMFGLVDRLLIRAPAYVQRPDEVRKIYFGIEESGQSWTSPVISFPLYSFLRGSVKSMRESAVFFRHLMPVGEGPSAWSAEGVLVTANFFGVLGVHPSIGRFFTEDENNPAAADPGVVLSKEVWKSRFGADLRVLGRRLAIQGHLYPIVGVAPRGFTGVELRRVDLWLPIGAAGNGFLSADWHSNDNSAWAQTVARVPRTYSVGQVELQAGTAYAGYMRAKPCCDSLARFRVELGPIGGSRLTATKRTPEAKVALWLAGVAAIVLAIACANVANLLLMRGFRRRREIAVRRALGMGQRRLVAQLATESLVLAVLGGVAALAATEWVGRPLRALLLPEVAWDRGPVDTRVFGLTVLAIFLAAFVTGVIPSFALGRANLSAELKSGGRGLATRRSRLQAALLVTQTTLSALLLVGAGWFLESVAKVRALHLGLDADRVLVTTIDFPTAYKPAEIATFYERALDRVRSVPGVAHASLGQADPFGWSFGAGVRVPGHDSLPSPETGGPYYNGVTEDFFATLGTRLLRGRLFSQADRAGTAPVAVINATMARLYWPNEESVGRCFYIGDGSGACTEVIGVVEDARRGGLTEGPTLQFYLPLGQVRFENARRVLFIRAAGEPAALIPSVRRALLDLSPTLPYARIESLQSRVDPQTRSWRLGATMLTAFGILALLVSAVGLYSTIAYSLTQRTLEIGVRMALGARSREVVRLVIGEGMRLALLGLGVGIGLAVVLGRQMRGLLFQTSPGDLRVLAIAAAVLAVAAVAASFFPASRAARLDPATTLRVE